MRTELTRMVLETDSTWGRYESLVNLLGHEVVCYEIARWMDSSYLKEALNDLMMDYGLMDDEEWEEF